MCVCLCVRARAQRGAAGKGPGTRPGPGGAAAEGLRNKTPLVPALLPPALRGERAGSRQLPTTGPGSELLRPFPSQQVVPCLAEESGVAQPPHPCSPAAIPSRSIAAGIGKLTLFGEPSLCHSTRESEGLEGGKCGKGLLGPSV